MLVRAGRLEPRDREVLLGDEVRIACGGRVVLGVDLGSLRLSLQGSVGLTRLGGAQSRRQDRVGQAGQRRVPRPVLGGVLPGDRARLVERAGVVPGAGEHRGAPGRLVPVQGVAVMKRTIRPVLLGVPLLDHAEAAELPLVTVEAAVMVGIAGDRPVAADPVQGLHSLDDVDHVGEPGHPRHAGQLVGQVEAGRGGVADPCLRAQVVARGDQQVRLAAAHQVHIEHLPARLGGQRGRPHQAGGAGAEQVGHLNVTHQVAARERRDTGAR
jgi:hypothetical protein